MTRMKRVAWRVLLFTAGCMGVAWPAASLAQGMVTGLVTLLRIESQGNENAARVQIANQGGCGGFFNVPLSEPTFPQMVAVLQTALVTTRPVTLVTATGCRISSVTISAQ
jgi:hypothetical protein